MVLKCRQQNAALKECLTVQWVSLPPPSEHFHPTFTHSFSNDIVKVKLPNLTVLKALPSVVHQLPGPRLLWGVQAGVHQGEAGVREDGNPSKEQEAETPNQHVKSEYSQIHALLWVSVDPAMTTPVRNLWDSIACMSTSCIGLQNESCDCRAKHMNHCVNMTCELLIKYYPLKTFVFSFLLFQIAQLWGFFLPFIGFLNREEVILNYIKSNTAVSHVKWRLLLSVSCSAGKKLCFMFVPLPVTVHWHSHMFDIPNGSSVQPGGDKLCPRVCMRPVKVSSLAW